MPACHPGKCSITATAATSAQGMGSDDASSHGFSAHSEAPPDRSGFEDIEDRHQPQHRSEISSRPMISLQSLLKDRLGDYILSIPPALLIGGRGGRGTHGGRGGRGGCRAGKLPSPTVSPASSSGASTPDLEVLSVSQATCDNERTRSQRRSHPRGAEAI